MPLFWVTPLIQKTSDSSQLKRAQCHYCRNNMPCHYTLQTLQLIKRWKFCCCRGGETYHRYSYVNSAPEQLPRTNSDSGENGLTKHCTLLPSSRIRKSFRMLVFLCVHHRRVHLGEKPIVYISLSLFQPKSKIKPLALHSYPGVVANRQPIAFLKIQDHHASQAHNKGHHHGHSLLFRRSCSCWECWVVGSRTMCSMCEAC